jgi:hypothetical protein
VSSKDSPRAGPVAPNGNSGAYQRLSGRRLGKAKRGFEVGQPNSASDKKGPSAGGLKALRPWVVPVCSKHNGATLARSLFTKRDLLD